MSTTTCHSALGILMVRGTKMLLFFVCFLYLSFAFLFAKFCNNVASNTYPRSPSPKQYATTWKKGLFGDCCWFLNWSNKNKQKKEKPDVKDGVLHSIRYATSWRNKRRGTRIWTLTKAKPDIIKSERNESQKTNAVSIFIGSNVCKNYAGNKFQILNSSQSLRYMKLSFISASLNIPMVLEVSYAAVVVNNSFYKFSRNIWKETE